MEDLAWMVRDSTSAWLRGYDDGRFAGYEMFYRRAFDADAAGFDLEKLNEEYATWTCERPSRLVSFLNRPIVARALIAFLAVWIGAHIVPSAAGLAPKSTGIVLAVVFIGLRVFHRKRKRS